jgi:glucose/arabinose dehydrogenase
MFRSVAWSFQTLTICGFCWWPPAAASLVAETTPALSRQTEIQLVPAFPGLADFHQPLCLATPPGDSRQLFVCEKTGWIKVIPDVTAATPAQIEVLDLAALLKARGETLSTQSEQGLLGLAFHPKFSANGCFYIYYSVKSGAAIYERVSRFNMQRGKTTVADPASELILLSQVDPAGNHNGGCLQFGSDGYLYIGVGDGGNQNDSLGNAQHIDRDFFSGILRVDVDKKSGNLAPNPNPALPLDKGVARYAVPRDNPFVGATSFNGTSVNPANVRTEFWAVGLRNPWRFSFDPKTGEMWCGDVGQNKWEEIDLITKGGNYGWSYRDGKHPGPRPALDAFHGTDPIYEYPHLGVTADAAPDYRGSSVTGGIVYRGSRISSLIGSYIFADYQSGNVWSLVRSDGGPPKVTRIGGEIGIVSFNTDPSNGDVLMANYVTGIIERLISGAP